MLGEPLFQIGQRPETLGTVPVAPGITLTALGVSTLLQRAAARLRAVGRVVREGAVAAVRRLKLDLHREPDASRALARRGGGAGESP